MRQRDIVLLPFPFSDQSGAKVRPALVLSNDRYNAHSDDLIVCAITSNLQRTSHSIIITPNDAQGRLHETSIVRAEKILSVKKMLVIKSISTLTTAKFDQVTSMVNDLITPSD